MCVSMTVLTLKALTPPSSPVPLPKGMRGTTVLLHSCATLLTCSTLWANTTTSGRLVLVCKTKTQLLKKDNKKDNKTTTKSYPSFSCGQTRSTGLKDEFPPVQDDQRVCTYTYGPVIWNSFPLSIRHSSSLF